MECGTGGGKGPAGLPSCDAWAFCTQAFNWKIRTKDHARPHQGPACSWKLDPRFDRQANHVSRSLYTKLFHGDAAMHLHGLFRQAEFPSDLLVA